jgi:hypothetical protein
VRIFRFGARAEIRTEALRGFRGGRQISPLTCIFCLLARSLEMAAASEIEAGTAQDQKAPSSSTDPTAPAAANANAENVGEAERNPIFDALATPDEDVAGLVAYSLYK